MSEPRWVLAGYDGKCSECECDFFEGDRVLWVPHEGRRADTYCLICGGDYSESRDDYEVEFDD